jgi:zinc and cadmium transporter
MSILLWIITFSLAGGILALIGGIFLLWREEFARKFSIHLISFATGTLLAAAFFDLIPEAFHEGGSDIPIFQYILLGIIFFFLIEKFFIWHHCHNQKCDTHTYKYMILIGDTVHNFIDGVIIALSFLVSLPLGFVVSAAVILHEIPQEIGDFGILIHSGMKRTKIIFYNILSAFASLLGAVGAYFFFSYFEKYLPYFLAIAAGNFIYIALSDLIPEIHKEFRLRYTFVQILFLGLGVFVIWYVGGILEH